MKKSPLSKTDRAEHTRDLFPPRTAEVIPPVSLLSRKKYGRILPAARDFSIGLTFVRYIYNIVMK